MAEALVHPVVKHRTAGADVRVEALLPEGITVHGCYRREQTARLLPGNPPELVVVRNLGVEAAQVAWLLGIVMLIRWIPGQFAQHALAYSAGGLSAFWLIQRSFALGT